MTNYQKLAKTNLYDLLCAIQAAHCDNDSVNISGLCIIENITKAPRDCPCADSFGEGCKHCISDWLREEAET